MHMLRCIHHTATFYLCKDQIYYVLQKSKATHSMQLLLKLVMSQFSHKVRLTSKVKGAYDL